MNEYSLPGALFLQKLFNNAGYKTLAVGGFVRDYLLEREPNDIDLTTQATPDQIEELLFDNDIMFIPIGIKQGTVVICLGQEYDFEEYQITPLRKNADYDGISDNVEFSLSFEEDAQRRDLTINAMYMDLETREIFDYVGGKKDLEDRILKFVGNSEERIQEDFLRLLRLFRFEAQLGFQIEKHSKESALRYLHYLEFISIERVKIELFKILDSPFLSYTLSECPHILFQIIPVLKTTEGFYENSSDYKGVVFDHLLNVAIRLSNKGDNILTLAGLLHDIAQPICLLGNIGINHEDKGAWVIDKLNLRLRLYEEDAKRLMFLVQNHHRIEKCESEEDYKELISSCQLNENNFIDDLIELTLADIADSEVDKIEMIQNKVAILNSLLVR